MKRIVTRNKSKGINVPVNWVENRSNDIYLMDSFAYSVAVGYGMVLIGDGFSADVRPNDYEFRETGVCDVCL